MKKLYAILTICIISCEQKPILFNNFNSSDFPRPISFTEKPHVL